MEERAPHIVFTDDLRAFSRKVVGEETNPYRIAQKLFAAVDQIPWAGAREYSTISNLSDYTLHAGHGDCGQPPAPTLFARRIMAACPGHSRHDRLVQRFRFGGEVLVAAHKLGKAIAPRRQPHRKLVHG